ncbi:MAG: hypothetical protein RJB12_999 [Pseudomonadota bacterium]|jgi:hypothetical protein
MNNKTTTLLGNTYRSLTGHEKDGIRRTIAGTCTEAFWAIWNEHKSELKACGVTCGKIGTGNRWLAVLPLDGATGLIAALKIEQGK